MSNSDRFAYVSFDRVPSPKGAAIHIAEFARALGREFGGIDLVTPDSHASEAHVEPERWPGVDHHQLPAAGQNLIVRALSFREGLHRFFTQRRAIVHFRSIFEGYPMALHKHRVAEQLVFVVNGLPSIELKYHHPDVADDRELLTKLRAQEDTCLQAADCILTPSPVTAAHLVDRGAAAAKIVVIPNGVHPKVFSFAKTSKWPAHRANADAAATAQPGSPEPIRMLYAGTFSAWQGVQHAIDALALLQRDRPARLTIIGPTRGAQRRQLEAWCEQAGVRASVQIVPPLSQLELAALHHAHDVVVAPLLANDRNTVQGCCPLKILEAMASGTPLIASDLPVVRDLARPELDALLVRPGSGKAIKDAILRLANEPGLAARLAASAQKRIEQRFTWQHSKQQLIACYRSLGASSSASSERNADTSAAG